MKVIDMSARSYNVMLSIFRLLGFPTGIRILDLTYGIGRFYRKIKVVYKPIIIAIDIRKYKWEVIPDIFLQKDANTLSIADIRQYGKIDVVVADPPWSHTKRGVVSSEIAYSKLPYHLPGTDPIQIVNKAIEIAQTLNVPLIVRYKEPLPNSDIVIRNSVVVFKRRGYVYYSIITKQNKEKIVF